MAHSGMIRHTKAKKVHKASHKSTKPRKHRSDAGQKHKKK